MMQASARFICVAGAFCLAGTFTPDVAGAQPLSLETCRGLALRANLQAAQAHGQLKSAEADVTAARSSFLPSVSLSGGFSKTEDAFELPIGGGFVFLDKSWSTGLSANLTVFDAGGNVFGYQRATRARDAADHQLLATRQSVIYETEVRFFDVIRQQELLEVALKSTELSQEQLKKTEAMKQLGASTQADVYKAEVENSNARLEEIRARRNLRVSKASLAAYIGRDPGTEIEIDGQLPELEVAFDLSTALERARESNPSLKAARLSRESSKAGVRGAKSDRYPTVSVFTQTSWNNFELSMWDDDHVETRYGASLNFNLFDGFLTKSNIRRAESALVVAEKSLSSAERDVLFQVEQAYLDLEVAREAIVVAGDAVRSSEEDLRLARERFKIGEGTILDVIDAQVNLRRALSTEVASRFDARLAHVALRNAIGDAGVPASGDQ
ncbi:MAG: transporter [Gemmatimonadota bacterium]|nr:MAG: transporter [Gemmatimonadota bacterium]